MEGFGVHIFRLVNAEGRPAFVKFRRKPKLGLQSVVWNEAVKINGAETEQVAFCTAAVSPYFFLPFRSRVLLRRCTWPRAALASAGNRAAGSQAQRASRVGGTAGRRWPAERDPRGSAEPPARGGAWARDPA
jgi:hypothetical protein